MKEDTEISKEEILRLYEQSELSDLIEDGRVINGRLRNVRNKFSFYAMWGAGILACAVGVITIFKRLKLFRFF